MISRVGVGIIGFGTVGTGVVKILLENASLISRRVGVPTEIVRIADLNVTRDRGLILPPGLLTIDAMQILTDPSIDIVVELIGGCDSAKRIILEAMAAGKHVVTANKALLALHGEEIFAAASRAGVDLGFEASVGGGIPVIQALREGIRHSMWPVLIRRTSWRSWWRWPMEHRSMSKMYTPRGSPTLRRSMSRMPKSSVVRSSCWALPSWSATKSKLECIPRCCLPHLRSPKSKESTTRFSLSAMP